MTTRNFVGESVIQQYYTPTEMREWTLFLDDLIEEIHRQCWCNSVELRRNLYTAGYDLQAVLKKNSLLIAVVHQLTQLKYLNVSYLPVGYRALELPTDQDKCDLVIWETR